MKILSEAIHWLLAVLPFIGDIEGVSCNLHLGQSQLILTFVHIYLGQSTSC